MLRSRNFTGQLYNGQMDLIMSCNARFARAMSQDEGLIVASSASLIGFASALHMD